MKVSPIPSAMIIKGFLPKEDSVRYKRMAALNKQKAEEMIKKISLPVYPYLGRNFDVRV